MEAELRRELARVARDIEVIIMLVKLRFGTPEVLPLSIFQVGTKAYVH